VLLFAAPNLRDFKIVEQLIRRNKTRRKMKIPPCSLLWVGYALLESKEYLLRFAYPHTRSVQPQRQLQQQVRIGLGVIVMFNFSSYCECD